jgi:hypothetical protein
MKRRRVKLVLSARGIRSHRSMPPPPCSTHLCTALLVPRRRPNDGSPHVKCGRGSGYGALLFHHHGGSRRVFVSLKERGLGLGVKFSDCHPICGSSHLDFSFPGSRRPTKWPPAVLHRCCAKTLGPSTPGFTIARCAAMRARADGGLTVRPWGLRHDPMISTSTNEHPEVYLRSTSSRLLGLLLLLLLRTPGRLISPLAIHTQVTRGDGVGTGGTRCACCCQQARRVHEY